MSEPLKSDETVKVGHESPSIIENSVAIELDELTEQTAEQVNTEVVTEQEEAAPTKILRQGPWMHPFPLIVGISIIGLLAALLLPIFR